jgi:hypothetical protein
MKKYTATEAVLRRLGLREYCKVNGHDVERMDYTLNPGSDERMYKCGNCDGKFVVEYPPLDFEISEK